MDSMGAPQAVVMLERGLIYAIGGYNSDHVH